MKTTNGVNILNFLFPFEDIRSFLSYVWDLMFAHQMAFLTLFLIFLLGSILFSWVAREVLTWFLQIKQIKKQNQTLIQQNYILMDKINHVQNILSKAGIEVPSIQKPLNPFTSKASENDIRESIDSIVDKPFIESDTTSSTTTEA